MDNALVSGMEREAASTVEILLPVAENRPRNPCDLFQTIPLF